ncbi:hypothetical protein V1227_06450 [Lentzea sp. DG1S-22]|uniref:hypothetical protein n=1 Tax=Lentzea sp. DG1S-22 TaxID=3108822 RepID=UPI002E796BED|nr:hypothetical protein [Lentzea sp. DG1S-22]WVH82393.1 hypothetical protein V1227_06450 [Lentzea sp. DG1S-22]
MSSPISGYDDAILVSVINETSTALDAMAGVKTNVTVISAEMQQVNRSTSGQKLEAGLFNWTGDFERIVGNLKQLRDDAKALLDVNRATSSETEGLANNTL